MKTLSALLLTVLLSGTAATSFAQNEPEPEASSEAPERPHVVLTTSQGEIVLELWPDKAPETVKNFLAYVEAGHFDGTIFHRVIRGFMIQGGGLTADMEKKPTRDPIVNEAGEPNARGTISMARTGDPNSATSQFFINTVDNSSLDKGVRDPHGYAVFGRVIEGMETVDAIEQVPTTVRDRQRDVPVEPVVITEAKIRG